MAYTHIKSFRQGNVGWGRAQWIAANSLACESWMLLKTSSYFVWKAGVWETIIWVSWTEKTFDSDNQTVAKEFVNYVPVEDNDTRVIGTTGQQIVFSAALVTSNTINLKVNWTSMTQVTYATSNDATLDAIATQLLTDFSSVLEATIGAARNWTRTINIVPKGANDTVVISNIVVAWWSTQATATVSELAIADGDRHKYYDITSWQYVNLNSASASTWQLLLEDTRVGAFRIVNA